MQRLEEFVRHISTGILSIAFVIAGAWPAHAATIFFDEFADNSSGWTLGTTWEIGSATASPPGQCCGAGDPALDHTPTANNGVAGVVIGGHYPIAVHGFYYLTSPVIGTVQYSDLELSYWRWLQSDWAPFITNTVEVFNGSSWVGLWSSEILGNNFIADSEWNLWQFDLDAYSNANLRVRFGYRADSQSNFLAFSAGGWNVDDVTITGNRIVGAVPEPGTVMLLGTGVLALARRWRKSQRSSLGAPS